MDQTCDAVKSTAPQEMWGETIPAHQGFSDGEDAYRWLYEEQLAQWDSITALPSNPDPDFETHVDAGDLLAHFVLRGPRGRVISAALDAPDGVEGEWSLDLHEAGTEIVATYDSAAHVLAGDESYDAWPPFELSSVPRGKESRSASREPYSALAAVWNYLVSD